MKKSISGFAAASVLLTAAVALPPTAQRGSCYQPPVYSSPSEQYGRDAFIQAEGMGGADVVGTGLGGNYSGKAHDPQTSTVPDLVY